MSVLRRTEGCDGARAQVSRRLDGELSVLEERMLDAHLTRCSDCRSFEREVARFTRDLRTAPLEPLGFPIEVGRSRRAILARVQVGIAAAVAVAVIGSVLHIAASSSSSSSQSIGSPTQFPTSRDVALEVQQIIASGQAFNRHRGGNVLPM